MNLLSSLKQKRKIFVLLVILCGIMYAAWNGWRWFMHDQANQQKTQNVFFVKIPDILVNLYTPGTQSHFLKMTITFEVDSDEDAKYVARYIPKIIDEFQIYLRDLRTIDLKGSEGIFRLKEQLMIRANNEIRPVQIKNILFHELLVQ